MSLRVVQFGLGPIGQASARLALSRPDLQLVGALDLDPDRVGKDVGEVLGVDAIGAPVRNDAEAALVEWKPDVVLHTTLSFLDKIEGQLLTCIAAGAHIVSSSEELFWPFQRDADFCTRVDSAAKEAGVSVVGTGVNPGFVMDLFPVVLSGVIAKVDRVDVSRSVDAGRRRGPLQKKVGAGLSVDEFRAKEAAGGFGHIGMVESGLALAAGFGWADAVVTETFGPHISEGAHETPHASVQPGDVAGIHQTVTVTVDGVERATLTLTMAVGAPDEDRVHIQGDPNLTVVVEGGTFGDTATVAAVVNSAAKVAAARPGLLTVLDLPAAATNPMG